MRNLKFISDSDLRLNLEKLVLQERKVIALVVEHIAEVNLRKLYLKWGFSSLFDYLTSGLGYSESSAFRRIESARALNIMPEIKQALEDGDLKLSQVSQIQNQIRLEEKCSGTKISLCKKQEIFALAKNKNHRETQVILNHHFAHSHKFQESEKHHADHVELNIAVSKELYEKLVRLKSLYSHKNPGANWAEMLGLMADEILKKKDPLTPQRFATSEVRAGSEEVSNVKLASSSSSSSSLISNSHTNSNSKIAANTTLNSAASLGERAHIPIVTKRIVYQRDQGKCQFVSREGKMCGSTYLATLDHIKPVFAGGDNGSENLRIYCKAHNNYRYQFGAGIRRA